MSGPVFQKAVKERAKLRLAIVGPAGTGKTYSALAVATALAPGKVALIDTEHGSASKYADLFDFQVLELADFDPMKYVEAIQAAERALFEFVIIDSLSHAWSGKGGALEQVDKAAAKSKSGSTYHAWRDVTPKHQSLVEAMLQCRCHVIATIRSKTEHVYEGGKVKKIGLQPVQREGIEYEFDLVGDIDHDHKLVITKSRIPALSGQVISTPGANLADELGRWLQGAEPRPKTQPISVSPPPTCLNGHADKLTGAAHVQAAIASASAFLTPDQLQIIVNNLPYVHAALCGADASKDAKSAAWKEFIAPWGVTSAKALTAPHADEVIDRMLAKINEGNQFDSFLAGKSDGSDAIAPVGAAVPSAAA